MRKAAALSLACIIICGLFGPCWLSARTGADGGSGAWAAGSSDRGASAWAAWRADARADSDARAGARADADARTGTAVRTDARGRARAEGGSINAWAAEAISLPSRAPDEPVKVAIIDTGISTRLIGGEHVAAGRNYVFDGYGTEDLVGHGTFVAGLISGAQCGEGTLAGVAPSATLTPLVFYSKYSSGAPKSGDIACMCEAIYDAIDVYGCSVINISAGITHDDARLLEAVLYAEEKGVVVVSAVGNDNIAAPERVYYPAAYDTVIGVGAVGEDLEALPQSQRNESVFACAPGSGISSVSIKSNVSYEKIIGTSYSTAYVTGMAAIMLAEFPDMTPAQFRWALQNTCRDIGAPGYDTTYGFGIIQIAEAVAAFEELVGAGVLPFHDVMYGDGVMEAVLHLYENGVMAGVSSTRFAPGETLTRAMFVATLYRLAGSPEAGGGGRRRFADVREGAYYSDAVEWAAANGVVGGVGQGLFDPDAGLSREQMAAILHRYEQLCADAPPGDETEAHPADWDATSPYARGAVDALVAQGVVECKPDGMFDPKGAATRGEAANALHRLSMLIPSEG